MTGSAPSGGHGADPRAPAQLFESTRIISEILAIDSAYCTQIRGEEELPLDDLVTEFHIYITKVLDLLTEMFTAYTGQECAVCIKALSASEDEQTVPDCEHQDLGVDLLQVYTFARDTQSRTVRGVADDNPDLRLYPYEGNSGLSLAKRSGFWFSNDLAALGDEYVSRNDNWPHHYNATAIVALAYPSEGKLVHPFGFLCVDNFGGGFDADSCRHIMNIAANILYYTIRMTTSAIAKGSGE